MRVGIDGFGRMGRLALRAMWDRDDIAVVHINEPHADATTCAHSSTFDSVHGRFRPEAHGEGADLVAGDRRIPVSAHAAPVGIGRVHAGVDVVLECSGRFRSIEALQGHLDAGAGRVVVAAPVTDDRALNVVMGANDHPVDPRHHRVLTAASCTTNCLAPVAEVLHDGLGPSHGSITTLHDPVNTQRVVDAPHTDLRRARAASLSLIPTTTGSATAIGPILPELAGRLDGVAVRVPLLNASLAGRPAPAP